VEHAVWADLITLQGVAQICFSPMKGKSTAKAHFIAMNANSETKA
jgi:hypothetical protein